MLSGEGNAWEWWKTTLGLIGIKQLCTCSTLFLYISLPLFCTTARWNFQILLISYTFYGRNVKRVLVHFFFNAAHFHLAYWWPLEFFDLSPLLQDFHVVLPTKSVSFVSLLFLALDLCRPFSRWASLTCRLLSIFSVFLLLYIPNLWTWQYY